MRNEKILSPTDPEIWKQLPTDVQDRLNNARDIRDSAIHGQKARILGVSAVIGLGVFVPAAVPSFFQYFQTAQSNSVRYDLLVATDALLIGALAGMAAYNLTQTGTYGRQSQTLEAAYIGQYGPASIDVIREKGIEAFSITLLEPTDPSEPTEPTPPTGGRLRLVTNVE